MIIKVDTRETALLQQINILLSIIPNFKSIKVETETLPIGDIIINDGSEDRLIIERKAVNDLLNQELRRYK
jgi:ERCC4-type nuclease